MPAGLVIGLCCLLKEQEIDVSRFNCTVRWGLRMQGSGFFLGLRVRKDIALAIVGWVGRGGGGNSQQSEPSTGVLCDVIELSPTCKASRQIFHLGNTGKFFGFVH